MTSRERVLRIFKGEPADRVACFEQTIACSVASEILGRRALSGGSALEYHEACAWCEGEEAHKAFARQVLEDNLELGAVLGLDMVRPRTSALPCRPRKRIDKYTFCFGGSQDTAEVIMKYDPQVEIFATVHMGEEQCDLCREVEGLERALEELSDEAIDADFWPLHWLSEKVGGEKAIVDKIGEISIPAKSKWLVACIEDPGVVERYLDCVVETALRRLPLAKQHGVDAIWAGGMLGNAHGPFYSPSVFRRLLLPRLRTIVDRCHELGLPYVYRTDGNIWPIAGPLLSESGIDGYGVSDVYTGMDIAEMRRRFPKLVLAGNISPRDLHLKSRQDVIDLTRMCIDKARGGGHIVGSANSVIHGTPAENVIAMFETAREYGK